MKVKSILSAVFWLILVYLLATRGAAINNIIASLGNLSLKSMALLQGRDKVTGVTA